MLIGTPGLSGVKKESLEKLLVSDEKLEWQKIRIIMVIFGNDHYKWTI